MSADAIPAVKLAVERILGEAEALKGVLVARGKPEPQPDELVAIWEAKATREFATIGPKPAPLDEIISLTLVVDVLRASGSDFRPAEERAWVIFEGVDAALRSDLSLDGVWFFDHTAEEKQEYYRTDKKRGCRIWLTLVGKARI